MITIFDSRDEKYRSPFGAAEENTRIHFKIILPRSIKCSAATLRVIGDYNTSFSSPSMFWCGMFGDDHEMWECHYITEKPGIYWYYFDLQTEHGKKSIFKLSNSSKGSFSGTEQWQITVYNKNFRTPSWLSGGIMYQIFPDRFYNSGQKKQNVPIDRIMQPCWEAQPDWRPNKDGIVTNSEFFGGDLEGIIEKLDYLKDLGVTCIYLNPIFEAHSNHRYNTADYSKVDPLLGTEKDFKRLCSEAKSRGINVILDGVFSHTGSDSVYFNKEGRYNSVGAYNSKDSQYYGWYNFIEWPNTYNSWWGFTTLPELEESNPNYNEYINGKNGIVQKWLKSGASGWRLDVADELPDSFIENIRRAAKNKNPDALVLGEVWEDASNKESYNHRRKFLLGNQLDTVMNYPFRGAILDFFMGKDAYDVMEMIMRILENYPKPVINILMNSISTHDTERAITVLAGEPINGRNKEWQANTKLTPEQRERGIKLLKSAVAMQYTLPGVPCIYYGDEAGMEGYKDPLNRAGYPWGKENRDLVEHHKNLAKMRENCSAFADGQFIPVVAENALLCYIRQNKTNKVLCAFNASNQEKRIDIKDYINNPTALIGSTLDATSVVVPALGAAFVEEK